MRKTTGYFCNDLVCVVMKFEVHPKHENLVG